MTEITRNIPGTIARGACDDIAADTIAHWAVARYGPGPKAEAKAMEAANLYCLQMRLAQLGAGAGPDYGPDLETAEDARRELDEIEASDD
jgi:hypothetical protein